jgi:hypothetical protein
MTTIKHILLAITILCFFYGLLVMLPEKFALLKKYGFDKANQDLIKMAKEGNEEVAKYYRKSKIYALIFIASGTLLVIIHQLTK